MISMISVISLGFPYDLLGFWLDLAGFGFDLLVNLT